jgi:uncharacterized protein
MSADEDVATIRRGYEAFNTGDMETLLGLFAESASWHTPGRGSLAGDHEGRDAAFAYFGQLGAQTEGTFRAALEHLTAGDGRVIGIHHNTGERNGKRLDVECCLVFRLEDGKIVDGREHFEDLYAWDDFWS